MYATSLEKQRKGNLYVYKFATGSRTPEYQPPAPPPVTERIIPSSVWGSLRRSKSSKSKPKNNGGEKEKEKEGQDEKGIMYDNGSQKRNEKERERERERKSVSSVEGILMSLANSNGKVSNDSEEVKEKGKGFPFPKEELQRERERERERGRKSISHVENNVAYVGKFVEKGRKSTGAKLENDVVSAIALLQVKVLVTDMPWFMQLQAFQCARKTYDSLEKFSPRIIAYNLKKEFDKVYGPAWHCIVGSSFGSFVTHATGCFLYFSMENLCILLFRTKVQKLLQQ